MADHTSLQKEIAALLFQNLQVEVSSVHDDLIEIGFLDSLKIVELLVELEHRYELKIPLQDLEIQSFRSVASIAHLVATLRGSPGTLDVAAPVSPSQTMPPPLAD